MNDINGFHVKKEHVFDALNSARSGPVKEGNVGGGTGMVCHTFKGGIGTSSRILDKEKGGYTVGVLVQANYGNRATLTIAGVPVGREIRALGRKVKYNDEGNGSIIVVVATDAPLLPHQLKRLARRVPLGISKVGGFSSNGSGDIFIAFSTANSGAANRREIMKLDMLPNDQMSRLFLAAVQATEEAIVNAMIAAETVDECVNEVVDTVSALNGITLVTADHGNLDEMDKYKTAHTLNPVMFAIVDSVYNNEYEIDKNLKEPSLGNIAATILNLLGYVKPESFLKSLIEFN